MRISGFVQKFLEGLAEIIDSLNSEKEISYFNPTVVLTSAIILTGVAAFSYDFQIPIFILLLSFILVAVTRSSITSFTKIILFVLFWATLVSLPSLFITQGEILAQFSFNSIKIGISFEGINTMIIFIARVVSAAAIFTSLAFIMGWRKMIESLEGLRVPREITSLLILLIIQLPFLLREASKMLSAREARIIKNVGFKDSWKVLATVVGDLFIRSYEHAIRLDRAIKARNLKSFKAIKNNQITTVNGHDIALLLISVLTLMSNITGML
ncbi:energy-coupling factor transporter transmembrane component T family protein [[Eubacterium] cellulosolvens]